MSVSSCRLSGLRLWPCETMTVKRASRIDLPFDSALGDFPSACEMFHVLWRLEELCATGFYFV